MITTFKDKLIDIELPEGKDYFFFRFLDYSIEVEFDEYYKTYDVSIVCSRYIDEDIAFTSKTLKDKHSVVLWSIAEIERHLEFREKALQKEPEVIELANRMKTNEIYTWEEGE